jgi:hypothetical protein
VVGLRKVKLQTYRIRGTQRDTLHECQR